ncbi:MAG: sulfatase-like hydrolase/transferase [Patescibacteria group bacterium]
MQNTQLGLKHYFGVLFIIVLGLVVYYKPSASPSSTTYASQSTPNFLGSFNTIASIDSNDVTVLGSYAYLVTDNNTGANPEFYIINIATSTQPTLASSLNIGKTVTRIAVYENYAYLLTNQDTGELLVVDISNKTAPFIASTFDIPGIANPLSIYAVNSTLYVGTVNNTASQGREFYILNASNPSAISLLGSYEVGAKVDSIVVRGERAYLGTNHNTKEIEVLNIASSSAITEVASYDLPGSGRDVNALDYSFGKLYGITNNFGSDPDFFIFNAETSIPFTLAGSIDLANNNSDIKVYGNHAYISHVGVLSGFSIVDVSSPTTIHKISTSPIPANVFGINLGQKNIYLATADNAKELMIFDSQEASLAKPNIVLILTDDQTPNSLNYMPIVQRELVNKGVKFTNGFVTTGLCCPSRVSIQTGQYVHTHNIVANTEFQSGASAFAASPGATSNIATWLHDVGYSTGYFGKYLNGYNLISPTVPVGWDKWNAFKGDNATGENNYYTYTLNEDGIEKVYYSTLDSNIEYYATDLLAARTVDFIKSKAGGAPFFAVFAPYGPHEPSMPAPRHIDTLTNLSLWRPPNWRESDVSDKSPWWQALAVKPLPIGANYDALHVRAIETLLSVDDAVGSITNALEIAGISNNTIIVYLSDNGFSWGEHWYYGKNCQYDECSKVPFVVRYPALGIIPRVDDRFVLNIDLAPTLAELAGITPQSKVNGRSFLKLLTNSENSWRNDFLLEGWNPSTAGSIPTYANVRNLQWEYIKSEDNGTFEELYNIVQDPYALVNVAGNPSNATVLSQMRSRLIQLQAE